MKIAVIAAIGKNGELGKDGKLPWHISADLKQFKRVTGGNVVVMGRKTFQSLPVPIKDRTIIVLSTKESVCSTVSHPCNVLIMNTMAEVIEYAYKHNLETLYIAGGGEMYKHFLPIADALYLTRVDAEFDADVYFPSFALDDWELRSEHWGTNGEYVYAFQYYDRKKLEG